MKISNSKKQLAEIIHENGGWRDGANLALFGKASGLCYLLKTDEWPEYETSIKGFYINARDVVSKFTAAPFANWHQTILSRDEYLHLYPAPDDDGWIEWSGGECPCPFYSGVARRRDGTEMAFGKRNAYNWRHDESCPRERQIVAYRLHKQDQAKPEFCEAVMRSIPEPNNKPTIEQLAAEFRNAKDYADRKQQEADVAKADAEAKLAELIAAGKALGLVLSVADAVSVEPEPELVITDWRDLLVGDIIEYVDGRNENRVGMVGRVDRFDLYNADTDRHVRMVSDGGQVGWPTKWRFIRRP